MKCKKIRQLLPIYIDQMCTEKEKILVEQHLAQCPGCQKELADLKKTIELVGTLKEVEPPKDMLEQISAKINQKSWWAEFWGRLVEHKIPVGATSAIILLLVLYFNQQMVKQRPGEIPQVITPSTTRILTKPTGVIEEKQKKILPMLPLKGEVEKQILPKAKTNGITKSEKLEEISAIRYAKPSPEYFVEMEVEVKDIQNAMSELYKLVEHLEGYIVSTQENRVIAEASSKELAEEKAKFMAGDMVTPLPAEIILLEMSSEKIPDFIEQLERLGRVSQKRQLPVTRPIPPAAFTPIPSQPQPEKFIKIHLNQAR